MRFFGNAAATPTEQQINVHQTDHAIPRHFAANVMLALTLIMVAAVPIIGAVAAYDMTGRTWWLALICVGVPFLFGGLVVAWLSWREIDRRYPKVPRLAPDPAPAPKYQPPPRSIPVYHEGRKVGDVDMPEDEGEPALPGWNVTADDLRAFVSESLDHGLGRAWWVPTGHKRQLPSGAEVSKDRYNAIIDQMCALGWAAKGVKGQGTVYVKSRRELAAELARVTGQAGGHRAGGQ